MTDEASPGLKKVEDLFKGLAWDTLITAALAYFNIDFWPLNAVLTFFTNRVYEFLRLQFDLGTIVFTNAEHKRAFDSASVTLKIVAQDRGINSPEFMNAKENARLALARFVHFGDAS